MKQDKITKEKIEKYLALTDKALSIAKKHIVKSKVKDAGEIVKMVECYLSDALFFKNKGDYVNAFAAVNYAHSLLDSGARLGIFNVKDNKLFTVR